MSKSSEALILHCAELGRLFPVWPSSLNLFSAEIIVLRDDDILQETKRTGTQGLRIFARPGSCIHCISAALCEEQTWKETDYWEAESQGKGQGGKHLFLPDYIRQRYTYLGFDFIITSLF